jgi:hypothetical protein
LHQFRLARLRQRQGREGIATEIYIFLSTVRIFLTRRNTISSANVSD